MKRIAQFRFYFEFTNQSEEYLDFIGFKVDIYGKDGEWLAVKETNESGVLKNKTLTEYVTFSKIPPKNISSYKIGLKKITVIRETGERMFDAIRYYDYIVEKTQ